MHMRGLYKRYGWGTVWGAAQLNSLQVGVGCGCACSCAHRIELLPQRVEHRPAKRGLKAVRTAVSSRARGLGTAERGLVTAAANVSVVYIDSGTGGILHRIQLFSLRLG